MSHVADFSVSTGSSGPKAAPRWPAHAPRFVREPGCCFLALQRLIRRSGTFDTSRSVTLHTPNRSVKWPAQKTWRRAAAKPPHRSAPLRAAQARRQRTTRRRARPEPELEDQIEQLQDDVRAIAKSLTRLGEDKVKEAQRYAKGEYKNLLHQGQSVASDVSDEFEAVEKQIKDTIRARPLTAMASAIGIGFLLAVLTR